LILEGDDASNMDPHFLHFRLGTCANIYENIVQGRRIFFAFLSHMNCWPSKYARNHSLVDMDIYSHRGRYHMIGSAISSHIDISVVFDIVDKPADFIGVSFDDYFKLRVGIDHTDGGSIVVREIGINVWTD